VKFALAVLALGLAGCASWPFSISPGPALLAKADTFAASGEYERALDTYGELLRRYPDAPEAARARTNREVVLGAVTARDQIARLSDEIARLKDDLAAREAEIAQIKATLSARDADLVRARQDLAARQAELSRLTAEAEQLRADLESLKRMEMRLERLR
jgi:septal ring factor EnvC (AmiA/AmiB activator)